MKERRVLQVVDLQDNNKQELAHSASVAALTAAAAKIIPCPIYPKESSRKH
jgi:hypothetical protein